LNRSTSLIICALFWHGNILANEPGISTLELDFSEAELEIINSVSGIPADVYSLFCPVVRCNIADYGEVWNQSDAIDDVQPNHQHRFSAVSDEVAAIVFSSSGIAGPSKRLFLMRRNSDWACLYVIPRRFAGVDTIGFIQMIFSQPGPPMKCNLRRKAEE
jgi:hypothetical protein